MDTAASSSKNILKPKPALSKLIPGLALGLLGAFVVQLAGKYSGVVNDVILAIILGFLIRNLIGWPELSSGLSFSVKHVLRLAIILLGAQLSWQQVMETTGHALWIILSVVIMAIPVVYFFGR